MSPNMRRLSAPFSLSFIGTLLYLIIIKGWLFNLFSRFNHLNDIIFILFTHIKIFMRIRFSCIRIWHNDQVNGGSGSIPFLPPRAWLSGYQFCGGWLAVVLQRIIEMSFAQMVGWCLVLGLCSHAVCGATWALEETRYVDELQQIHAGGGWILTKGPRTVRELVEVKDSSYQCLSQIERCRCSYLLITIYVCSQTS